MAKARTLGPTKGIDCPKKKENRAIINAVKIPGKKFIRTSTNPFSLHKIPLVAGKVKYYNQIRVISVYLYLIDKEGIIMKFRHLRIFTAVCETMSMTKAARHLYISQPAVSQTITELEEYYDVRLFERM